LGRKRKRIIKSSKRIDPFTSKNWFNIKCCPRCGGGPVSKQVKDIGGDGKFVKDSNGDFVMKTVMMNPLIKNGKRVRCVHGCGLDEELNS